MRLFGCLPRFAEGSEVALNSARVLVQSSPGMSHLMGFQLGFLFEAGQDEPFDDLSARIFSESSHLALTGAIDSFRPVRGFHLFCSCRKRPPPNMLQATRLSTESFSSITVVPTYESAFNFDTDIICLFLSKDGAHNAECRKVQQSWLHIELFWQEVDIVLVGLLPLLKVP